MLGIGSSLVIGWIGPGSAVVIGLAALIIFGPKKLPELGRAAGKTLKEFKSATQGIMDEHDKDDKKDSDAKK
ncbi:twin-arginine translocase TatA/TatE family subunit [Fictibacillus iocasae]|uniref:Twin-arginine translocase TatA/TatE family subunit n=1 Tax=Fictibacillus iocasae TaxID=2715437 RepID=A0ABW2NPW4_9BACL